MISPAPNTHRSSSMAGPAVACRSARARLSQAVLGGDLVLLRRRRSRGSSRSRTPCGRRSSPAAPRRPHAAHGGTRRGDGAMERVRGAMGSFYRTCVRRHLTSPCRVKPDTAASGDRIVRTSVARGSAAILRAMDLTSAGRRRPDRGPVLRRRHRRAAAAVRAGSWAVIARAASASRRSSWTSRTSTRSRASGSRRSSRRCARCSGS